VIVAELTFSLPICLPQYLGWYHVNHLSSAGHPFLPLIFSGQCFRPIPASCSSAFPVPPQTPWVSPIKQPFALEAEAARFCVPQRKWGKKKEKIQLCLT
jgi:hypothetical protein